MAESIKGFMIDSARCLESREYYRRFIRFIADQGMNTLVWHFSDDQGLSLDFPSVPGLADPHAYSASEARGLVEYARGYGITLVPELETLGHSRYLTRHARYRHLNECDEDFTAICPVHPETRDLMRKLIKDVVDIFPSPWVHVGMDEVKLGQHPLTREALKSQSKAELLADYARFIYDEVAAYGRRMIMWVDENSYNTGVMEYLPRDIVAAVWQYSPDVSPELAQKLLNDGFNVILCPALITYDQQAYPGDIALPNIERMSSFQELQGKGKVEGVLTTIWTPMRYLHDCLWPGVALAASVMNACGRLDIGPAIENYLKSFHDATPDQEVVDALIQTFYLAPRRKEYLSILKADFDGEPRTDWERAAEQWTAIAIRLESFLPSIQKEVQAFETLQLFCAFMAHLYSRAALFCSETEDIASWHRVIRQDEDWLEIVESIWDQERFPDDSRKSEPVFDWEENEYMLVCFRKSLRRLKVACPAPAVVL